MTDWIIYLLKVIAIQGVLFLFYWAFLRHTLRHQLNRLFLLLGLVLAFAIPFIELPTADHIPIVSQNDRVVIWLSEPTFDYEIVMSPIQEKASNWSLWLFLPFIYILVAIILLTRSAIALMAIKKLRKHSEVIKKYWFSLFKTSHSRPFSFFSNVFIPKTLFDSEDFDQVLAHECVHVKQRHSVDRLLLDFVVSLFWFNPFIYLYRNALIEIHEYQADEAVVKRFKDPIRYQEILFSQLQTSQYSGMVSHFNFSMIKKRIVMMNKQNKKSVGIYLIALPLTLAMIFAFSSKEAMTPIEKMGNEIAEKVGPNFSLEFPEIQFKNDYIPSILPLKNAENVRFTSGFGMRMHPIFEVEKMHLGTDFSCQKGNEVIASADGIVDEIKTSIDGYGKMISIIHDDKYQTRYAQLSEFSVKKGDKVKKGQLIGYSGNSGASTAPHLHYEVIEIGKGHVDPQSYIKNYEFKSMVRKSTPSQDWQDEENTNSQNSQGNKFTPSIAPILYSELVTQGSGFEKRTHPIYKVEKMHYGIDFNCKIGTEVIATADGIVEETQISTTGYGKKILIKHGDHYKTLYAHLSEISVEKGSEIRKGQLIGLSGNTGGSTQPHLHYEVIKIGTGKVNPRPFIQNYEFKSLMKEKAEKEQKQKVITKKEKEEKRLLEERLQKEIDSNDAKQEAQVRIDGFMNESTSAENQPLFVLNGKVMKQYGFDDVDASEIERIEVLKNKKAFDKYGDAGKNGVVEITTKNKQKSKDKAKDKKKEKNKSKNQDQDPRMDEVEEFLFKYEGDDFNMDNWNIVFKEDKVKLKKRASLESITLYNKALGIE